MKLRSIVLLSIAALTLSVPATASDSVGWYVGLGVGRDMMESFDAKVTTPYGVTENGPLTTTYKVHPSDTALFTGSFGYRFRNRLRVEDEVGFDQHVLKFDSNLFTGHGTVVSDFVNVLYDYRLGSRWDVFVGAGVGAASLDFKASYNGASFWSNSAIRPAGQAIVGFTYSLSDRTDIGLDYRYRAFIGDMTSPCGSGCSIKTGNMSEQVAMFNLRFYLWPEPPPSPPPPPPPPPPPVAPPPPPPPPPAPVRTFIVFFDFNKANLTDAARSVVADAVRAGKANGFVKVLVTGHTDTVGSDSYNMKLSVRRAQSVKDEMVREGIDDSTIAILGMGFHSLLVPTGMGVREPQNRRAVIEFGQ
jgi:OmpA-OmpF porin, OOP family